MFKLPYRIQLFLVWLLTLLTLQPSLVYAAPTPQSDRNTLQNCDLVAEEAIQSELNSVTQEVVATAAAEIDLAQIVATQWNLLQVDRLLDTEVDNAVLRVKNQEDFWNKLLSGWSATKAEELTRAVASETFESTAFQDKMSELSHAVAQEIGEEIAVLSAQSVSAAFFCLQTFISGNYSDALVGTFEEEVRVATQASTVNENDALDSGLLDVIGQHKTALGGVGVIIVAQISRRIMVEIGETIAERVAGRIVGRLLGKAGSTIIPVAGWLIGAGLIAYDVYSSRDGALPQIQETLKSAEVKEGIRAEIIASTEPELRRELPQIAREISNQLYNEWRDVKRNIRQVLELAGESAAFNTLLAQLTTPEELSKLVNLVGVTLPTLGRDGLLQAVDDGSFAELYQQPEAAFQIVADTGSLAEALAWSTAAGTLLNRVVSSELYKHQPPTGLDQALLEKLLAINNDATIQKLALLTPEALQALLVLSTENLITLADQLDATELALLADYVQLLDQAQVNQLVAHITSNPETVAQLSNATLRDYLTSSNDVEDALGFLLTPTEGLAAFTDMTKVLTGVAPWQLFLYKYGMGQSALVSVVAVVALLIALRLLFGLIGWLFRPITSMFR